MSAVVQMCGGLKSQSFWSSEFERHINRLTGRGLREILLPGEAAYTTPLETETRTSENVRRLWQTVLIFECRVGAMLWVGWTSMNGKEEPPWLL